MRGKMYDLNEIPLKYKPLFRAMNNAIQKAIDSPGKIKKINSGSYCVKQDNELIFLDKEGFGWIAREFNGEWYSDPFDTLKDLKKSIGIE